MLPRLLDRDDIHKASRVRLIGTDTVVYLYQALLDDGGHLTAGERVLQTVAQENSKREGFPELVGTGRRTGSLETIHALSKMAFE